MRLIRFPVEQEDFLAHAIQGLSSTPKRLSPKFFYDERGSKLFEEICQQPEYYVPKTEIRILNSLMQDLIEKLGPKINLAELGSGASVKTRILLESFPEIKIYIPIDISEDFLEETAKKIDRDFPKIEVVGICADFTAEFELPTEVLSDSRPLLLFFPGSSIGNFEPPTAKLLVEKMSQILRPNDYFLIGVDQKKDRGILESAYNDAAGVTAEFNKNILLRLQNELGAKLKLDNFFHRSFFNPELSRIEMHLVAKNETQIQLADKVFSFQAGDSIHTECSYKYDEDSFLKLTENSSLHLDQAWSDEKNYFSVFLFIKRPS